MKKVICLLLVILVSSFVSATISYTDSLDMTWDCGNYLDNSVFCNLTIDDSSINPSSDFIIPEDHSYHWLLDTNGTFEEEDGKLNGTITDATYTTDCVFDGCYQFDGSGDKLCLDTLLPLSGDYTFTFWAKINAQNYQGIVGGNQGSYSFFRFGQAAGQEDNNIFGETSTDGDTISLDFTGVYNTVPLGTWAHYAIRLTNKEYELYINGTYSGDYDINDANITFRCFGLGRQQTDWLNGTLDDIMIYERALTDSEIHAIYHTYHSVNVLNTTNIFYSKDKGDTWLNYCTDCNTFLATDSFLDYSVKVGMNLSDGETTERLSNSTVFRYLNDLEEEHTEGLEMLPIVILYIGILAIGYWLLSTGNHGISLMFLSGSSLFNYYFWQEFGVNNDKWPIGIFFMVLTLGSVVVWLFAYRKRRG